MRNSFGLLLALAIFSLQAEAAIKPIYQDIKLPTQKVVEYQAIANIAAASSNAVLTDSAGPTSASALVLSSGFSQPDVPRNLSVIPTATTADVGTCTVTIAGTDILNDAISENFAFAANASTATTGSKAFKTITSISFAAACEDSPFGARWSVGLGEKVGVKRCMDKAGHILFSTLNGAKEATAPTMAADASVVSLNTADYNGTMNGSNDFELFFFQNFRCK